MVQEVELKLELSHSGATSILKRGPFESPPTVLHQRSMYFDTAEWDLAKHGYSLRIRQSGNERMQTIKATDGVSAGSFTRNEWERPVASSLPVLDETPIRSLLDRTDHKLEALFEVDIKRHLWNVTEGDAAIEVALDMGKIVAGDRDTAVCEIEFEHKAGPPGALFALGRKVDLTTPAHIGVLSNAERGYRLLGPVQDAVKASILPLKPDMDAGTAFAHIAAACLKQFRVNEMILRTARHAEALHQARVSLRRLRSLFSICRSMFQDRRFEHLRDELRWLASELGDARSIDVMLGRAKVETLSSRLQEARDHAYGAAETALSSARARALMLDVAEWISVRDWRSDPPGEGVRQQATKDFASGALGRLRKKVTRRGDNLIGADDEARHELRKTAKKLRYAAEFFAPLFHGDTEAKRHRRFIAAMEELQEQLGLLNDLVTTPVVLAKFGLTGATGTEALFGAADKSKLLRRAAKAHDVFVEARRFWR
ncbi:inorganic triphosphatase [Pararhizobium sp. A13]|uniref:CYTH and CHAD domain-containing protein n=1 Tax=Pararhizobium sp. A13 TaxID=3133975 RepID=UPI00311B23B0